MPVRMERIKPAGSSPAAEDDLPPPSSWWQIGAETVWLPTAPEMARLDRDAVDSGSTTERTLIECAGREIARRIHSRWPGSPVLALAGRGHNGADALVAARTLAAWGHDATAFQVGSAPPDPDVRVGWDLPLLPVSEFGGHTGRGGVIIDGILGTGLTGPPRPAQAEIIQTISDSSLPVVAVDGPSGVNFTTGAVDGACVRAAMTVTLGWPKLGLLRLPAREYCGDLLACEIGFPPLSFEPGARLITARWVRNLLRPRHPGSHKGDAGYLALVAGDEGMAGAAILAARAALRGGVGILRVMSHPGNREIIQESIPGAIFVPWDDAGAVVDTVAWAHALTIGPGLGRQEGRRDLVSSILAAAGDRPVVVDADALSIWSADPAELANRLTDAAVLTPHPGEMARLLGSTGAEVTSDPPAAAREAAARFGCTVVLKGSPTVVAAGTEPLRVSSTLGAGLAAGGTGDVLAGLVGAYLAAGLTGADAAAAALQVSGLAAERSNVAIGHLAADLPDRIPSARGEIEDLAAPACGSVLFGLPGAGS